MANSVQQGISKDKFLVIAINLLHRHFIACGRTMAKRLFQEIQKGRTVPITTVTMEDESTVRFQLSLDHSEVKGPLNFGAFRAGVSVLVGNISQALKEEREVTVFNREQRPESMLFGITGVTLEDNAPRVLALGADVTGQGGPITLQLMYLDPAQLNQRDDAAGAAPT